MYLLSEHDQHLVSGGNNGIKITLNMDVPVADAVALQGLLVDLFTDQLTASVLAQALLAMPDNFNDMKFVSLLISEY